MRKHIAYPSAYLKAADFPEPVKATISHVMHEPMSDAKLRPIVFLEGFEKGIVCNVTNADVLYSLAGTDDDVDWVGLTIEIFTMPVTFNGKSGLSIRFRPVSTRRRATGPSRADIAQPRREQEPPPVTEAPDGPSPEAYDF